MPRKILYIDAVSDYNELLKGIASKAGCLMQTCAEAQEAMKLLQQNHYPVIIANIRMPGMDDITLCSRIRKTHPNVIIYAVSEPASGFNSDSLDAAGFDGYMYKPYNPDKLQKAIGGALQRLGYNA